MTAAHDTIPHPAGGPNAAGVAPSWLASRRDLLGLLAAMAAMPLPALAAGPPATMWPESDPRRRLLEVIGEIVIPATDTPGAAKTGVARFVELALRHGLDGTRDPGASAAIVGAEVTNDNEADPQASRRFLMPVKTALDAACDGDFLAALPARRTAAVVALDAAAFRPGGDDHPWHKIKDLILLGYYTSETGGSQELRYELVPGRWDPDVPLTPATRAFSSDWTAVEFG